MNDRVFCLDEELNQLSEDYSVCREESLKLIAVSELRSIAESLQGLELSLRRFALGWMK